MIKQSGLALAVRRSAQWAAAAIILAGGAAECRATVPARASHPVHAHRLDAQDARAQPDFSHAPTSRAGSAHKKTPGAKSKEHPADEGHARSGAHAKTPAHKGARKHTPVDQDYEPIEMSRVEARKAARRNPAGPRHIASADSRQERERSGGRTSTARDRAEMASNDPHRRGRAVFSSPHAAAQVDGSASLSTSDFLSAAHGSAASRLAAEPSYAVPYAHAGHGPAYAVMPPHGVAQPTAPYASGVSHPPATDMAGYAAGAPQSFIDATAVAQAQHVAIGEALRPHSSAELEPEDDNAPGNSRVLGNLAPPVRASVSAPPSDTPYALPSRRVATPAASDSGEELAETTPAPLPARLNHEEMAEAAIAPRLAGLYAHDGQLVVPPALKGSHEVLVHQNEMADAAGLTRIRNDADLDRLRRQGKLVDFPETSGLRLNPDLPERRRCARPWTVEFAGDMAKAFYTEFHESLTVSSAVRTVAYQVRLQRVNGNAAATSGEGASPHLTGQAFDIGKTGLSVAEIAWMRNYLLPVMNAGKIDVEEEFQQACFHISVYPSYAARRATHTQLAMK
jgi:hypothetical protein